VDLDRPSVARIYDYYLGGAHNFAVDRAVGEQAIRIVPELPDVLRANRAFLRRAVRFMMARGIRQFLDLGSGIPTVGNVHEVAHAVDPRATVVYVDHDAVAVAHSRSLLDSTATAAAVQADLTDPDLVLKHTEVEDLLDFDRPVGILLVAVLHFVPDAQDPGEVIRSYRRRMAPGSMLALSHGIHQDDDASRRMHALYSRSTCPLTARSKAQVEDLLDGFDVVEPGVVDVALWRNDEEAQHATRSLAVAAVGRRP
jgi:hypothetical protein